MHPGIDFVPVMGLLTYNRICIATSTNDVGWMQQPKFIWKGHVETSAFIFPGTGIGIYGTCAICQISSIKYLAFSLPFYPCSSAKGASKSCRSRLTYYRIRQIWVGTRRYISVCEQFSKHYVSPYYFVLFVITPFHLKLAWTCHERHTYRDALASLGFWQLTYLLLFLVGCFGFFSYATPFIIHHYRFGTGWKRGSWILIDLCEWSCSCKITSQLDF